MKIPVANESRYSYYLKNLICISCTLFYMMELTVPKDNSQMHVGKTVGMLDVRVSVHR